MEKSSNSNNNMTVCPRCLKPFDIRYGVRDDDKVYCEKCGKQLYFISFFIKNNKED